MFQYMAREMMQFYKNLVIITWTSHSLSGGRSGAADGIRERSFGPNASIENTAIRVEKDRTAMRKVFDPDFPFVMIDYLLPAPALWSK